MKWAISILGVVVLYLLSIAPLGILANRSSPLPRAGLHKAPPDWLKVYAAPGQWIYENTPLQGPLRDYGKWCWKTAASLN